MSDEKKASSGGLTKLMAGLSMGLIMFFASLVWKAYEDTTGALGTLNKRIEKLEDDKAKWGTLTEVANKTISMEIEMSRLSGMMQGFALAVQSGVSERKPVIGPPELPKPLPLVPSQQPQLKDPKELFRSPEDFKKMQQHKYPLDLDQQKK